MGNIRNVSGQSGYLRDIGELGDGEVAEVADDRLYSYTASANFEPVGADSKAIHEQAAAAEATRVAEEQSARSVAHGISPAVVGEEGPEIVEVPAGTRIVGKPKGEKKPTDG